MKGTRHSEEQIISILKQGEAGLATADLCRQHGITEQTYYRWKAKYGGIETWPNSGTAAPATCVTTACSNAGRRRSTFRMRSVRWERSRKGDHNRPAHCEKRSEDILVGESSVDPSESKQRAFICV